MKKNVLIILEALVILALIYRAFARPHDAEEHTLPVPVQQTQHLPKQFMTIGFPDIQLRENERIIAARMRFQNASIKAIKNIPPGWFVHVDLDPPPNPSFRGNIEVGAAALGSPKELPEFEVGSYSTDKEPGAQKAIITVTAYPGDGRERNIEVELNKP